MLKLKRVELQGFKSFCDRTELRFNGEGIAAIVGPNGCGKSNISDAISWVLGEQSAKSLRGTRMEDVIFAGTRDRKPLGMAYVTMTLVDPDVYDETRRPQAPRRGGRPAAEERPKSPSPAACSAPAKANTSSTATPPACATSRTSSWARASARKATPSSSRAASARSSAPSRRTAAPSSKRPPASPSSKPRKRLAEAKLEGAKQNLARVYDILEEVTRQVNSLKRQAAKAKRYGELKAELDAGCASCSPGKYRLLERDAAKTALDLNVAAAS